MAQAHAQRRKHLLGLAIGAALCAGAGALLVLLPAGRALERLSYDLPFLFRSGTTSDVVMIYLDDAARTALGQPLDAPLDRRLHARLIDRLTRDGARLVLFDFIVDTPAANPDADAALAEALRRSGRVVLAAQAVQSTEIRELVLPVDQVLPPLPRLREAAAGWGLANVHQDSDFAVRRIHTGMELAPSLGWAAAEQLGAPVARAKDRQERVRWLNYYGPPGSFVQAETRLDHAHDEQMIPPGFYRDRIVVIGTRNTASATGLASDMFATPHSRFGGAWSPGAEIQTLTLLNLIREDWLERLDLGIELVVIIALGLGLGAGLMWLRPLHAAWVAGMAVVGLTLASLYLHSTLRLWWNWLVPVAMQAPTALVCSIGWQYGLESARRRRLRQAFSAYLSPHLADRIAESDMELTPGGRVVQATIMFTDLEGFSALAEDLKPPEVSQILIEYFTRSTEHILEQEGAIIKYIGDAVMAVWGAPLADERQAERAVKAALGIIESGRRDIAGRRLRTRIGINTGPGLAGNLGSKFRFDYTVIGATTNFASRLEGLNKFLGTQILIADATRQKLGHEFCVRRLGSFVAAGTTKPFVIHEVLGRIEDLPGARGWIPRFEAAIEKYRERDWSGAEALLREVMSLRGGADGPSHFYLDQIAEARVRVTPDLDWDGTVTLLTK
ncbi:MAG TPA: adenylate/guanylate cyclase domain-containing protein [Methylomirabilota bacterium]|nr:adenylate/guanylate cyclase domain-containing protein [Methylomirabilota bacterium]